VAKSNTSKKKVVVSKKSATTEPKKVKVTKNKVKKRGSSSVVKEMPFGKKNFQLALVGIVLRWHA